MSEQILGDLHISSDVIADIAGVAAAECYGVVGMVAPDTASDIATILPASRLRRGIVVEDTPDGARVHCYIVVEYGNNISTVSQNLVDTVTFALEDRTGVQLAGVEVHVKDVKIR